MHNDYMSQFDDAHKELCEFCLRALRAGETVKTIQKFFMSAVNEAWYKYQQELNDINSNYEKDTNNLLNMIGDYVKKYLPKEYQDLLYSFDDKLSEALDQLTKEEETEEEEEDNAGTDA